MGTWGVKLNQNDVYSDLKDIYTALLRYGKSDEEALEITVKYFSGSQTAKMRTVSFSDCHWLIFCIGLAG